MPITDKKVDIDLSGKVDVALHQSQEDQSFVFRQTGGGNLTIDAKNAELTSIKGRTLVLNQLVRNLPLASGVYSGLTVTNNGDGTYTFNGTTTGLFDQRVASVNVLAGHKYFVRLDVPNVNANFSQAPDFSLDANGRAITTPAGNGPWLYITIKSGVTLNNVRVVPQVTDLTLAGIADEISTPADFETIYPGYHPYNPGTLISNDVSALETVGFNQFNKTTALVGKITQAGGNIVSNDAYSTSDYIAILPETKYYAANIVGFSVEYGLIYFDSDKNYLSATSISGGSVASGIFTTPKGAAYVRINVVTRDISLDNVCINLSDPAKNGTYEPYRKSTMQLGLNSIKVKSHNIWDEEWEVGTILPATGQNYVANDRIRSKNYIKVFSNTTYYFKGLIGYLYFYDAEKNFIFCKASSTSNKEYTMPAGCYYLRFIGESSYGTTYANDICINVSSSFNGQYEPHGILTFNGVKSAGSVYDEIVGNKYIKRVGSVDLGDDLGYNKYGNNYRLNVASRAGGTNFICARYSYVGTTGAWSDFAGATTIGTYIKASSNETFIGICPSGTYSDSNAFSTAHSGVMLYYELATPIEYELVEPIRTDYPVDKLGTERVISDTVPTPPFRADITYHEANIKDIEIEGITEYLKREELTDELDKLDTIEEGAQVNKIEHITLGGTEQTITNKTVNLPAYPTTLPASDVSA